MMGACHSGVGTPSLEVRSSIQQFSCILSGMARDSDGDDLLRSPCTLQRSVGRAQDSRRMSKMTKESAGRITRSIQKQGGNPPAQSRIDRAAARNGKK